MKTNEPKIKKNADKSFVISFTITREEISLGKVKVLTKIQKEFETKGFRKGKAPLDIVEQNLSNSRILEETASEIISQKYTGIIESEKLQPIIQPQVKITNAPITIDKDWEVEITGCELPPIKIDPKYRAEIKKINAQGSIKTATELKADSDHQHNHSKLDQILDLVLKNSTVVLPDILIEADTNQRIAQLVDQVNQAGLKVEDYLKSQKLTPETYRQQVADSVAKEWTLNLAIADIAKAEGMKIEQVDIEAALKQNQALAQNPNLLYYLIQQQKVLDFLQKL